MIINEINKQIKKLKNVMITKIVIIEIGVIDPIAFVIIFCSYTSNEMNNAVSEFVICSNMARSSPFLTYVPISVLRYYRAARFYSEKTLSACYFMKTVV